MIERITPHALADLFRLLSQEDQWTFRRLIELKPEETTEVLIGRDCELHGLYQGMSAEQQKACTDTLPRHFPPDADDVTRLFNAALPAQRDAFRDRFLRVWILPFLPDDWTAFINENAEKIFRPHVDRAKQQGHQEYKAAIDRKSAPATVTRNIELCDRRRQDKRTWSLKKLARVYGISIRAVTKILKTETRWRRFQEKQEPSS